MSRGFPGAESGSGQTLAWFQGENPPRHADSLYDLSFALLDASEVDLPLFAGDHLGDTSEGAVPYDPRLPVPRRPAAQEALGVLALAQAAMLGHQSALWQLGLVFVYGPSRAVAVPRDVETGVRLLRLASALGHPQATSSLAYLESAGFGGPLESSRSTLRFIFSASQRDPYSLLALAARWGYGLHGLPMACETALSYAMAVVLETAGRMLAQFSFRGDLRSLFDLSLLRSQSQLSVLPGPLPFGPSSLLEQLRFNGEVPMGRGYTLVQGDAALLPGLLKQFRVYPTALMYMPRGSGLQPHWFEFDDLPLSVQKAVHETYNPILRFVHELMHEVWAWVFGPAAPAGTGDAGAGADLSAGDRVWTLEVTPQRHSHPLARTTASAFNPDFVATATQWDPNTLPPPPSEDSVAVDAGESGSGLGGAIGGAVGGGVGSEVGAEAGAFGGWIGQAGTWLTGTFGEPGPAVQWMLRTSRSAWKTVGRFVGFGAGAAGGADGGAAGDAGGGAGGGAGEGAGGAGGSPALEDAHLLWDLDAELPVNIHELSVEDEQIKLMREIATTGNASSLTVIGLLYLTGLGQLPREPQLGFRLLRRAVQLGDLPATYLLSVLALTGTQRGDGIPKNQTVSQLLLSRAVAAEFPPALNLHGILHLHGWLGYPQNVTTAYRDFSLAHQHRLSEASYNKAMLLLFPPKAIVGELATHPVYQSGDRLVRARRVLAECAQWDAYLCEFLELLVRYWEHTSWLAPTASTEVLGHERLVLNPRAFTTAQPPHPSDLEQPSFYSNLEPGQDQDVDRFSAQHDAYGTDSDAPRQTGSSSSSKEGGGEDGDEEDSGAPGSSSSSSSKSPSQAPPTCHHVLHQLFDLAERLPLFQKQLKVANDYISRGNLARAFKLLETMSETGLPTFTHNAAVLARAGLGSDMWQDTGDPWLPAPSSLPAQLEPYRVLWHASGGARGDEGGADDGDHRGPKSPPDPRALTRFFDLDLARELVALPVTVWPDLIVFGMQDLYLHSRAWAQDSGEVSAMLARFYAAHPNASELVDPRWTGYGGMTLVASQSAAAGTDEADSVSERPPGAEGRRPRSGADGSAGGGGGPSGAGPDGSSGGAGPAAAAGGATPLYFGRGASQFLLDPPPPAEGFGIPELRLDRAEAPRVRGDGPGMESGRGGSGGGGTPTDLPGSYSVLHLLDDVPADPIHDPTVNLLRRLPLVQLRAMEGNIDALLELGDLHMTGLHPGPLVPEAVLAWVFRYGIPSFLRRRAAAWVGVVDPPAVPVFRGPGSPGGRWRSALVSPALAVRYYVLAADLGSSRGMFQLARALEDGRGIARDVGAALALYRALLAHSPFSTLPALLGLARTASALFTHWSAAIACQSVEWSGVLRITGILTPRTGLGAPPAAATGPEVEAEADAGFCQWFLGPAPSPCCTRDLSPLLPSLSQHYAYLQPPSPGLLDTSLGLWLLFLLFSVSQWFLVPVLSGVVFLSLYRLLYRAFLPVARRMVIVDHPPDLPAELDLPRPRQRAQEAQEAPEAPGPHAE